MILVEVLIPKNVYTRILMQMRRGAFRDVILEMRKSKGATRVFLKNSPKGWWAALRILREGAGKLYVLKEVSYMDIPSKVLEIGMKERWSPEFERIIEEELRRWGLAG
jgi:alpha-amylase/alpha-mannosidase (GH57 family)